MSDEAGTTNTDDDGMNESLYYAVFLIVVFSCLIAICRCLTRASYRNRHDPESAAIRPNTYPTYQGVAPATSNVYYNPVPTINYSNNILNNNNASPWSNTNQNNIPIINAHLREDPITSPTNNNTNDTTNNNNISNTQQTDGAAIITVNPVSPKEEKEKFLCPICDENEKNVALGCGHMLCESCTRKVKLCPFCKTEITYAQRIFL
eukprot:TRINITY_DN1543_c0_g2_i1.p1 TRINITY_DN1543_c0_g2~~TRINITY_DN1543_c0_g2_i1.p1  ORF type:complete len:206 (-),score=18.16 TRINITY_DN1543_c0_g2_i1:175-792(-)